MRKLELLLLLLSAVAVLYKLYNGHWANQLVMIVLLLLALFYFGFGVFALNGIRLRHIFKKSSYAGVSAWRIVGSIIAGIGFSMVLIGVLFKLLFWPGYQMELLAGLIAAGIVSGIAIVRYMGRSSMFFRRFLNRMAYVCGLGFIIYIIPDHTLIDIYYRDHPAMASAMKKWIAEPYNVEYEKAMHQERSKIK